MQFAKPASLAQRRGDLGPGELVELSRRFADDVLRGRYPQLRFDAESRWHERIYRDTHVDVWLITWLPSQGTQLHDHGGSSGAFTVVSGRLDEAAYAARSTSLGQLVEFTRRTGSSVGFGPHYIHDVRNLGDEPAVSVHAYSRPLDLMNYYDIDDGALVQIGSLETDDPETEFVAREAS